MLRITRIVPVAIGAAVLLAACGNSTPQPSLSQVIAQENAAAAKYLPVYNGIPATLPPNDSPGNKEGFPYVVPDVARVLLPNRLEAAVKNTKETWINGNYIGAGLTPNERMAIYSMKMLADAYDSLTPGQYLFPPAGMALAARIALTQVKDTLGFVYQKPTVPNADLTITNPYSLNYRDTAAWNPWGMLTVTPAVARAKASAGGWLYPGQYMGRTPPSAKDACYVVTLPAGSYKIGTSAANYGPSTAKLVLEVCVLRQPGQFRRVWPMVNLATEGAV